ncbi:MAG: cellulase family glycosylhydrolase [Candidatus Heimdallarchaeota archaeon]|nr:MAG: cellulase family glycosylhydrolase [Candidatus Heimdallarchaeota archaeon]
MNSPYVKVDGSKFLVNGNEIIFRGFGIGNWLNIEHFMIGLPGSESQLRRALEKAYGSKKASEFWEKYYNCYIKEADFQFLSEIGVNSIRISFNYRLFESDLQPYSYNPNGFNQIDRILKLCEKYKIYAILDLHAAPGGQNPDWHSDNAIGEALFWEHPDFQNRVIELWKYIAQHYCNNPWVAAYDLMNEPCYYEPRGEIVDEFYHNLVRNLRKVDKNHIFFIEGDFYGHFFTDFTPYEDPNIAYSFHFYPSIFGDYVEINPQLRFDKIQNAIFGDGEIDYVKNELQRPLWCGETGISLRRGNSKFHESVLRDTIAVFEKHGVSWSIWTFKDARSMGCLHPKTDSPWMKFSVSASGDWKFSEEFQKYLVSNEVLKNMNLTHLPNNLQRKLNFRLLANNQLVLCNRYKDTLNKIPVRELLTYPESFLFENCEQWHGIIDIVKTYTKS